MGDPINLNAIKELRLGTKVYYSYGQKGHIKRNYRKVARSINKTLKVMEVVENSKRTSCSNNKYWKYSTHILK